MFAALIIDHVPKLGQIGQKNVNFVGQFRSLFADKNAEKSCRLSDAVIEDYVEIVILKPNKDFSKKMFNTWEIFSSNITSTFLYGNTLLFGTSCGSVSLSTALKESMNKM